jgi:hypothetical protein
LRASIPRTGAFAGFYFEVFAEKGHSLRLGKPGERSALSPDSKSRSQEGGIAQGERD